MTDQRKPPGKPSPKALLDELTSIQSLLGDADKDVEPSSLLDDDVPLLDPAEADIDEGGDHHQQISLLDGPERPEPLNKALLERENPFLPRKVMAVQPPPTAKPAPAPDSIDEARLHALADEVLADWMPKIEQDLRNRLLALLRKPS
ncbi:hypothetical protein [Alcanivorax sp. 1008]|uniref:hypothetical protein n=1 Tax=Alcanivorax sp. 1008 TaxID=2816853 RepID=UPI001DBC5F64|nr:hypothetical protein [Alcanivorax sp. 1008]MCC1495195.1 hypothetical protein [Alcanivorax sp. 1008]